MHLTTRTASILCRSYRRRSFELRTVTFVLRHTFGDRHPAVLVRNEDRYTWRGEGWIGENADGDSDPVRSRLKLPIDCRSAIGVNRL